MEDNKIKMTDKKTLNDKLDFYQDMIIEVKKEYFEKLQKLEYYKMQMYKIKKQIKQLDKELDNDDCNYKM